MDVNVKVNGQKMSSDLCYNNIASGSQEFVRFCFELTGDWSGLKTFAQFSQDGNGYNVYLDDDNCAYLPPEIEAGKCSVMLYGTGGTVIGTTNSLGFYVKDNGRISDASTVDITPTLYEQLIEQITAYTEQAKASETNASISESNAKLSETNAANSATSASASEAKAKEYMDSATQSAVEAAGYAGAATYSLGINPETGHMAVFYNAG